MKATSTFLLKSAALVLVASTLNSCRTPKPPQLPPEPQKVEYKYPGEWTGGDKPITQIIVNTDTQRATLYSGEEVVGWTYVASGITSFPTPLGDFSVLEKVKDKVSNLYGKSYNAKGGLVNSDFKQGRDVVPEGGKFVPAPMKYFMRLTNDGVGMHIGVISKPGRRASHGCIRLPSKMAPILYEHTALGTPVKIVGTGPDYATYLKQSAAKARANAAKYASAKKAAAEAAEKKAAEAAAAGGTPPATTPTGTTPPATTPGTPAPTTPAPAVPALKEPPAPTPPAPAPAPAPAPGTAQ